MFFKQFFKVVNFARKKYMLHLKKILKMYYFFSKRDNWAYIYIYTKCNDNFKFAISLKSYEEYSFA